jgi:hypothetical protein
VLRRPIEITPNSGQSGSYPVAGRASNDKCACGHLTGVVPGRLHANYRDWGSRFGAKSRLTPHSSEVPLHISGNATNEELERGWRSGSID